MNDIRTITLCDDHYVEIFIIFVIYVYDLPLTKNSTNYSLKDGEIWTFTVRQFNSTLPDRTISVNYEGFAEGPSLLTSEFSKL